MQRYTKAQLEKIVLTQHENLEAMHDLLKIMKFQTDLIKNVNQKVSTDLKGIQNSFAKYPTALQRKKQ
ncbi:MAG: hypothetical protein GQ574_29265 [Crocinitomix sp.]|nr:hypothetical protein [Crocinitomix sp.]